MNKGQKLIKRMTIIGIMIGVATVILIMNLGQTVSSQTAGAFLSGPDLVQVTPEFEQTNTGAVVAQNKPEFTLDNLNRVKRLDYVKDLYPRFSTQYQLGEELNNEKVQIQMLHKDFDIKKFYDVEITQHSEMNFFGVLIEDKLFDKLNKPTTIEMSGRRLSVAGTFKSESLVLEDAILVEASTYEALFDNTFMVLSVRLDGFATKDKMEKLEEDLADNFTGKYTVESTEEMKKGLEAMLGTITNLFLFFGFLTVLVSGIGIMNLTYITISNERNQICIKRAIGASPFEITKEYLLKIFGLTLQGTVLGIAVGLGLTYLLISLIGGGMTISVASIVLSFVFSFGLSLIFGLYPVQLASKENIVNFL
jgi:putative ABC transport system permease protein